MKVERAAAPPPSPFAGVPGKCGARNRQGFPCKKPAVAGKKRCRLHGGAPGSGAPAGKKNGAYRHGRYTKEARERRAEEIRRFESAIRMALEARQMALVPPPGPQKT